MANHSQHQRTTGTHTHTHFFGVCVWNTDLHILQIKKQQQQQQCEIKSFPFHIDIMHKYIALRERERENRNSNAILSLPIRLFYSNWLKVHSVNCCGNRRLWSQKLRTSCSLEYSMRAKKETQKAHNVWMQEPSRNCVWERERLLLLVTHILFDQVNDDDVNISRF